MATVSSLGAGSGLALSSLLTSLMAAEQQPLVNLQTKEASYQSRISALGSLKGALSSLQTAASNLLASSGQTIAEKYTTYSASVADAAIASATVAKGAVAGTYSLEVTKLAQTQRLASATPFAASSTSIGQGTLNISLGTLKDGTYTADSARSFSITIDSTNNTLAGLRDAINAKNGGVSATIVNGTAGSQLVLTAKDSGTKNVMKIEAPDVDGGASPLSVFAFDPVTATGGLSQDTAKGGQTAQNAEFLLNGIAATSSTNSVSDALDGVTLNLSKVSETGKSTQLTVSVNSSSALTTSLTAFVKAYNEANKTIADLGAYNATTKTAGALQGQAVLRTAQSQLRNIIFGTSTDSDGKYQRLSDIGVTFGKDGSLSLDSTKLSKASAAEYAGVTSLVEKVGKSFKTTIESLTGTNGSITSLTASTNSLIKALDAQSVVIQRRLAAIQERYTKQFTALDTNVTAMNKISSYLTTQLANLPGAASK